MIILAWNGGSPSDIFDPAVFKKVLSIFISAAILKLGQGKTRVCMLYSYNTFSSWFGQVNLMSCLLILFLFHHLFLFLIRLSFRIIYMLSPWSNSQTHIHNMICMCTYCIWLWNMYRVTEICMCIYTPHSFKCVWTWAVKLQLVGTLSSDVDNYRGL